MGWKLDRFAEMHTMDNVLEIDYKHLLGKNHELKGNWSKQIFGDDAPIVLELGCGKGEYTVGQARMHPDKNFIGIDIKGARMWVGAKLAEEEGLSNVRFLRTRVDFITSLFGKDEVSEIWITFADPQPQKNRARKRLTAPMFLDRYAQLLKPEATINLKTDSDFLYEFTKETIEQRGHEIILDTNDLYAEMDRMPEELREALNIRTYYESMWLEEGLTIKFLQFKL